MNQTETNQTILELMNNSILLSKEETNQKILKIMNKDDDLSQKEFQLFKELIFQCDLKIQGTYGFTPIMYALRYNQSQNLNLNQKQWDYLIKKSDLKQQNNYNWTPLMHALNNNKTENLNLNEEQWDYLIKNSDLTKQNKDSWTPLMHALINNKKQDLKFKNKHFQTIYDALDEKQKQITFQNLIQRNIENNHQYQEEINILLYDIKFKPNKKTLIWLKENKHQDIIQRIEKRDLFFQLNKDFKEINNQQNRNKIKI